MYNSWQHVQPIRQPECPKFHRNQSTEVGMRIVMPNGRIKVYYKCQCGEYYSRLYKLSNGAPGTGMIYLSTTID